MDIDICGRHSLTGLLADEPGQRDLIVVSNPLAGLPDGIEGLPRRLLHLEFDDQTTPGRDVVLVTIEDIRRALEWSADYQRLIVSCHAGISRSAALAYVIACRDHPPRVALGVLTRRWHVPNERIVRLGADVLADEEIYRAFLAWRDGSE